MLFPTLVFAVPALAGGRRHRVARGGRGRHRAPARPRRGARRTAGAPCPASSRAARRSWSSGSSASARVITAVALVAARRRDRRALRGGATSTCSARPWSRSPSSPTCRRSSCGASRSSPGPGSRVGEGTAVSPAGTQVGVVPGIPVLGIIPESTTPVAAAPRARPDRARRLRRVDRPVAPGRGRRVPAPSRPPRRRRRRMPRPIPLAARRSPGSSPTRRRREPTDGGCRDGARRGSTPRTARGSHRRPARRRPGHRRARRGRGRAARLRRVGLDRARSARRGGTRARSRRARRRTRGARRRRHPAARRLEPQRRPRRTIPVADGRRPLPPRATRAECGARLGGRRVDAAAADGAACRRRRDRLRPTPCPSSRCRPPPHRPREPFALPARCRAIPRRPPTGPGEGGREHAGRLAACSRSPSSSRAPGRICGLCSMRRPIPTTRRASSSSAPTAKPRASRTPRSTASRRSWSRG